MRNRANRHNAVGVEGLQGVVAPLDMIDFERVRKRRVVPVELAQPPSKRTVSAKP